MSALGSRHARSGATFAAVLFLGSVLVLSVIPSIAHGPSPAAEVGTTPPHEAFATLPPPQAPVRPSILADTWINVTAPGAGVAPAPGYGESVATDPVDRVTLLFGGCLTNECPSNQTWEFANGSWENLTSTAGSPPGRYDAAFDYDPNMHGFLLFGGSASGSDLNDTWMFANGSWRNLSALGAAPPGEYGGVLAFDPAPDVNGSVFTGGCVADFFSVVCSNATWVWEGWSGWVPWATALPGPAVGFAAMAYDPIDSELVLYGGCSGVLCLGVSDATWVFYGGQWWEVNPTVTPGDLSGSAMVFDPSLDQMILFGGSNQSFVPFNATYTFQSGEWSLLSPSAAPSPRFDAGLALDPAGDVPLLVGGLTAGPSENDTWVLEPRLSATVSAAANASETNQPIEFTVELTGGTGPYALTVAFGDGSDLSIAGAGPSFSFSHAYLASGSYAASLSVTDSVGVRATATAASVHLLAGPSVTASALPSVGEVGLPVGFTAGAAGGAGPYSYAWQFGDAVIGTGAATSHTFGSAGTFRASVESSDSLGGTANATVLVVVRPAIGVGIHVVPNDPTTGSPVGLAAVVTGGVGPFTYSWVFGNGTVEHTASPIAVFTDVGSHTLTVYVNDSLGGSTHASVTVSVSAPAPTVGSGAPASIPLWFWGGVGALAAVAIAGTALLLRRGRASSP
ncbi:MAG TPA: PKD domain-containing protein [Thermoplasmata archaeon]|nr:PKD domain-containing protein [Thermoplasmata archaeon]